MPLYEYEHESEGCAQGKVFERRQSIKEPPLTACPACGRPVRRLISRPNVSLPKSDRELKEKGFTKLVRRGKGEYENVTAREGEKRIVSTEGDDL